MTSTGVVVPSTHGLSAFQSSLLRWLCCPGRLTARGILLLIHIGDWQHLGNTHRCTLWTLVDREQGGSVENVCTAVYPKGRCRLPVCDLFQTCSPRRDHLPKGWQPQFLYDGIDWFLFLEQPGIHVKRNGAWHDERFSIEIADTATTPLEHRFALDNRLSLIQHKVWNGDLKPV